MICWGIDPGYARLGFGVVVLEKGLFSYRAHGVIETSPDLDVGSRLLTIEKLLTIEIKAHPPDVCMIEEVFFRKNLTTGVQLLQARGVVLLTMARTGARLFETTPTALKKMITGHGGAQKQQIQQISARLLGLKKIPEPDDAADALALAIAAALRNQAEQKTVQNIRKKQGKV